MGNSFSHDDVGSNSSTRILQRFFNATIEHTYTKNAFEDLVEELIVADIIPMEVLIADYAEYKDSHEKAQTIIRSMSGITSVISSSIFIWMIMRSHNRLSTTQHRLLLGLCISDIIFSLGQSTFNVTSPSENNYMVWNARGNQTTCDAQGFFVAWGGLGGLLYNASLNLYFLAVVKYNKSDEYIRARIEPFLHGVPIVVNLSYCIYRLVKKTYNSDGSGNCIWPVNTAPHCEGYDVGETREGFEIPCWRGIAEGAAITSIFGTAVMFIPIIIMMISLGMIYSAVRTREKKLAKYGVGALRSNLQQQSINQHPPVQDMAQKRSSVWSRISTSLTTPSTFLKSMAWPCKKNNQPVIRSNNITKTQSRAVMYKAFGYTFAWFLSWGIHLIGAIIFLATGSSPLILSYIATIFAPLQGLFNLLIFMHPKILAAKRSKKRGGDTTVSWCQAFNNAFWSRGKEDKTKVSRLSDLRGGHNNHLRKKNRNEGVSADSVKAPMFGKIKKKKRRRPEIQAREEEKYCCRKQQQQQQQAPDAAAMAVEMKKGHGEHIHFNNTLSDVKEDPHEDDMSNQEEEMKESEEDNVDAVVYLRQNEVWS